MADVLRQPDMSGPPMVFHYRRNETDGTRTPVAYRLLPGGEWITDPSLVLPITEALFERDAAYARAMQAIAPILTLPPTVEGEESTQRATRRLDVDDKVVIGVSAVGMTDAEVLGSGEQIIAALLHGCGDLLAASRIAIVWAD